MNSEHSSSDDPPPDLGVAATGYICQNEPEHPIDQPEVEMVNDTTCVVCPECGRRAGGPDDEIPYGDPEERDHRDWRCRNCGTRPRLKHESEPDHPCRHCQSDEWVFEEMPEADT